MVLRHLAAVVALPVTVTVVIPLWLARRSRTTFEIPTDAFGWLFLLLGVVAVATGLMLFAASLRRFAVQGHGTLAPWDPPRQLVVAGPYRHVRNPMISGVLFILIGEALVLRSSPHAWWAAIFAAVNVAVIAGFEEPQLERRFGDAYRAYRRHVPRIIPRRTPWHP